MLNTFVCSGRIKICGVISHRSGLPPEVELAQPKVELTQVREGFLVDLKERTPPQLLKCIQVQY